MNQIVIFAEHHDYSAQIVHAEFYHQISLGLNHISFCPVFPFPQNHTTSHHLGNSHSQNIQAILNHQNVLHLMHQYFCPYHTTSHYLGNSHSQKILAIPNHQNVLHQMHQSVVYDSNQIASCAFEPCAHHPKSFAYSPLRDLHKYAHSKLDVQTPNQ